MIKVKLDIKTKDFIRSKISFIEQNTSGIYFLMFNEKIVYVGKSINIKNRIDTHINEKTKVFNDFKFILCSEDLLDSTELSYIYYYNPIFNKKDSLTNGIGIQEFCDNNLIDYDKIDMNRNCPDVAFKTYSDIYEVLGFNKESCDKWINKNPRQTELIKKGLLYEKIESGEIEREYLQ